MSASPIRCVTVYSGARKKLAAVYQTAATELGRAIAEQGWGLVYGGDSQGLMGLVADGVCERGGTVVGIMPQVFVDMGNRNSKCHEFIVTPDMRSRKQLLEERGDAMIALPGGLGTLEEFFEIVVGRLLELHRKPIVLLNIARYYEPLLDMIEHGIEHNFIHAKSRELFFVATTVKEAIDFLSKQASTK